MGDNGKPVLWHIPISHYNEKVRWALAYKGIEHERKAPLPGAHQLIALALTRGDVNTFPYRSRVSPHRWRGHRPECPSPATSDGWGRSWPRWQRRLPLA